MKFEKITIPPGWQESFTKYPNGKTIFEALSATITTVNEGIEEVNQKVNQGLLDIEQAENTIRNEITDSFNTLQSQLEGEIATLSTDLLSQWASFQLSVNAQLAEIEQKVDVDIPAQLNEIEDVLLPLKANKSQENWIAPTLVNGWVNYGTSLQEAGYFKDDFGFINIRGGVKNGVFTSGTGLFELPLGYRPYRTCSFVLPYLSNQFAIIAVQPTGKVAIASAPGNVMLQLNNIRFKVV